jgi:phage repressor protein C with HTH and peptisase S24 domain
MVQNEKVRQEFSKRLALACNNAEMHTHGRGIVIARSLSVSPKAVSKWFNGEAMPRQDKMNALATLLKVDPIWLQHGDVAPGNGPTITDKVEYAGPLKNGLVRVVGEAMLGVDGAIEMVEANDGWLKIYSDDPDAFGLRVRGDSMWPRIKSGEYVLVEPNRTIYPGDEVFVRTSDGHNMIKVLGYDRDGEYQFISINQAHNPVTLQHHKVEKLEYVSGILKQSRHIDDDEVDNWLQSTH